MNDKIKLTEWFPASVAPARKGVYRTTENKRKSPQFYSYWNGRSFNGEWVSADRALYYGLRKTWKAPLIGFWRGIAK